MSKCTAADAVKKMEYWIGYYEKASSKYVKYTDKAYFELDKGTANWTHAGYISGVNPGAWCAMQVGLAIYEACGNSTADAKKVLRVWPYTIVRQTWEAADGDHAYYGDYQRYTKGRGTRTRYTPKAGDIIIFTDDKGTTKSHTGMVYSADDTYVYTIEGNSGNMCRKRSYRRDSSYIYGYVQPDYAKGGDDPDIPVEQYGEVCCTDPELHILSKGCAGGEVATIQRICYSRGYKGDNGETVTADGEFGNITKAVVIQLQKDLKLEAGTYKEGTVDAETWKRALKHLI